MKSRRYRQLIKNPIVRLLRPIFRFFYRLFAPKRSQSRFRPEPPAPTIEAPVVNRPPTLGETLEAIDWQFTRGTPVNPTELKSSSTDGVASRNKSNRPSPTVASPNTDRGSSLPSSSIQPAANTTRLELAHRNSARTMTVGELFDRVRWQHHAITTDASKRPPANFDASRN